MARFFKKGFFFFLAVIFAGCAAFTSKQEYWLFRQIMEAKDLGNKAELYREYVSQYPSGTYAGRIKDVQQEIEFAVYNATGQDKGKIHKYIELFPDGRFTADAKDKLVQLDALEQMKTTEAETLKKKKEEQARLAEEKRKKYVSEITGAMADWTSVSISTYVYGISVTELAKASKRFKELWSSEPLAECSTDACLKSYELSYHYQVMGATRIDRIIRMVVLLKFREGKIRGMSVNFIGRGFIGLRELIENEPQESTKETLEDAGGFAADLLISTLQSLVPTGKELEKEGYLFAYESEGANYYIVRTDIGQGSVVDSLVIQLIPPPEPDIPKKKKKKKDKPPPQPVMTVEELIYIPQAPAAPAAAPAAPAGPLPAPNGKVTSPPPPPETKQAPNP